MATMRLRLRTFGLPWLVAVQLLCAAGSVVGQDVEPRRWSHLPTDANFGGVGYAYTRADVFFDPVLQLSDVTLDLDTVAAKYIRTFALLDHSARLELGVPYQHAHWEGLLQGTPAEVTREGLADPTARFAVNLLGAPPLEGAEFASYRATHPVETIVGAGLTVQAPLGEYYEDKLLNLGENRYSLRPELGVEQTYGKWMAELTGTVAFFTDNDEFWGGNERQQDPVGVLQSVLVYTFRPGLWVGGGIGYGSGGESTVNGTPKHDVKGNLVTGISIGAPISRTAGIKVAYQNSRTQEDTGADSDTFVTAVSVLW